MINTKSSCLNSYALRITSHRHQAVMWNWELDRESLILPKNHLALWITCGQKEYIDEMYTIHVANLQHKHDQSAKKWEWRSFHVNVATPRNWRNYSVLNPRKYQIVEMHPGLIDGIKCISHKEFFTIFIMMNFFIEGDQRW